jgi:hypothetical protein
VKTSTVNASATKTPTMKTSAVRRSSSNADRGDERDGDKGGSHQQLAVHWTLLFAFASRLRHRISSSQGLIPRPKKFLPATSPLASAL